MNVESSAGAAREILQRQDNQQARTVEPKAKVDEEERDRSRLAAAQKQESREAAPAPKQDPGPHAGRQVDISV